MVGNYLTMSKTSLPASDNGEASTGAAGTGTMRDGRVQAVREFNRVYTNRIGLLRGGYLDSPYSLTEARVLFELAQASRARAGGAAGARSARCAARSTSTPGT